MKDSQLLNKRKKKRRSRKAADTPKKRVFIRKKVVKGSMPSVSPSTLPAQDVIFEDKKEIARIGILHKLSSQINQSLKAVHRIFRKYETTIQLMLIPSILLIVFLIVYVINQSLKNDLYAKTLSDPEASVQVHPYPVLINSSTPTITADSAIIIDDASQVVLFSKNPTLRFSMASTTKVMTALVGLDYYPLNAALTVKDDTIEGSKAGLKNGQRFTFGDLLYALLLPSGNDAAYTIAENYPGGLPAFVQKMNEKAQALHLYNTHYGDPAGLQDEQDYTTVGDLARLTSYAMNNRTFATVVGTKEKTIMTVNFADQLQLKNLNQLLGTEGVNGVKTGTTDEAGQVLITSDIQNGHTYIIVVMRSQDRFADTQLLLNLITNNVDYLQPSVTP